MDGFIAHLLVFMPVTVVDVRPLTTDVTGLEFVRGDATSLDSWADDSVPSISSLHAVEHFGLGRYGDRLDPNGASRAMGALARVLAPGGQLYFSVPIGAERVEFNAQRVFAPATILQTFAEHGLQLAAFSAVDDRGFLVSSANPLSFTGAHYSCGLFEFQQVKSSQRLSVAGEPDRTQSSASPLGEGEGRRSHVRRNQWAVRTAKGDRSQCLMGM